jgi:hypothetical protein
MTWRRTGSPHVACLQGFSIISSKVQTCHSERSEESLCPHAGILRCAQDDITEARRTTLEKPWACLPHALVKCDSCTKMGFTIWHEATIVSWTGGSSSVRAKCSRFGDSDHQGQGCPCDQDFHPGRCHGGTLSSCRSFLRPLSGSPGNSRYASSQCHSTPGHRGDMRTKMQEI